MDTLTHTLMGGTIVGLATIDPNIDALSTGFIITVVGASLVPDTDTILKLKDNATYIKNHRGITHSLPFTFLVWPMLITFLATLLFDLPFGATYLWVQLAVFLHVFVDIFNSYGTQALRPIDFTWIQIGIINTVDYFIIIMHVLYFLLWFIGFSPVELFFILYAVLFVYYVVRFLMQRTIKRRVEHQLPHQNIERVFVLPTLKFFVWRVVVVTETHYYIGQSVRGTMMFYDTFEQKDWLPQEIHDIVKFDKNLRTFIFFSSIYRYELKELDDNKMEVRFIDLRYLKNGHYSFVAIMIIDLDKKTVEHSYTGWVFSEERLQQILLNN